VAVLFDGYPQFYEQPADYPLAEAFRRGRLTNDESLPTMYGESERGQFFGA
jgi:hypothetical protein